MSVESFHQWAKWAKWFQHIPYIPCDIPCVEHRLCCAMLCHAPRQENLRSWMRFWIAKTLDTEKMAHAVEKLETNLETNLDCCLALCLAPSERWFFVYLLKWLCLHFCQGPISAVSPKAAGNCGWDPVLEEATDIVRYLDFMRDIKISIFDLWVGRSWTTCDSLRFWMMVSRKVLRILCSPALDSWFFTVALWRSQCVIL